MSETPDMVDRVARLRELRANLLENRNHVQYNIGSPAAIDHLLVSLVATIEAFLPPETPIPPEPTSTE